MTPAPLRICNDVSAGRRATVECADGTLQRGFVPAPDWAPLRGQLVVWWEGRECEVEVLSASDRVIIDALGALHPQPAEGGGITWHRSPDKTDYTRITYRDTGETRRIPMRDWKEP